MSEKNEKQGLSCAVAQDLMPLYVEGLTQEETTAAMEAHISQCPACSQALGMQQAKLVAEKTRTEYDKSVVRFLKFRWSKRVLATILAAVLILLVAFGEIVWLQSIETVPLTDIAIAGKYRLPDGRIMLAIQAKGLNQQNVHHLNVLEVMDSIYPSVSSISGNRLDSQDSRHYELSWTISLRRRVWNGLFPSSNKQGNTMYILLDEQTLSTPESINRYVPSGFTEENVREKSLTINGYEIWNSNEELRQVTEEEAALLLSAYETQEAYAMQEFVPRLDVPDALDALKDAASSLTD